MRRLFQSPLVTILFILYVLFFGWFYTFIPRFFDLPQWSALFLLICIIWLSDEIPSRFGVEKFDTKFSLVWKSSLKDRVLFLFSLIGIVILNFLEGYYYKRVGNIIGLAFFIPNILLFITSINLFGSSGFKQIFNQKMKQW